MHRSCTFRGHDSLVRLSRQTKVENLHPAIAIDHHILRLQVAMADADRVRGGDPVGQLDRDIEQLANRHGPALDAGSQQFAVDQFADEEHHAVFFADVEHGNDIGMVQRRHGSGLAFEPGTAFGTLRNVAVKDFQSDIAAQSWIAGAVHLAHTAGSQRSYDLIGTESATSRNGHTS
jgi:hypothetical protein